LKFQHYNERKTNNYFWRTHDRQEIDWVEDRNGKLSGYEFKYTAEKKNVSAPAAWKTFYPEASFKVIHKNNFDEFIL